MPARVKISISCFQFVGRDALGAPPMIGYAGAACDSHDAP